MPKAKLYSVQMNQIIEDKFKENLQVAKIKLSESTLSRIRLQEKMVDHYKQYLDTL
jgi:hypothetical protein